MPPRRQLAARRKAVGHSQESLARQIDVSAQSVARWEQGTSTPLARYRRPLAEHLSISLPELELLIDGASDTAVAAGNWLAFPGWLDHYASLEQAAARLQTFEPISLPGLLQTQEYAEAVVRSNWVALSDDVVRERVEARLARQGGSESSTGSAPTALRDRRVGASPRHRRRGDDGWPAPAPG